MSSSDRVTVCSASRSTSWSPGNSSFASARNTAVQLGSSATTRPPDLTCPARARTVRVRTLSAVPSCPVETQVSPQHSGSCGNSTRQPACSRTRTAARPMCGWKWLVKVSGHSSTDPRRPSPSGSCSANHRSKVSSANSGTSRSATPATSTAAFDSSGAWVSALTTGASRVRPTTCASAGSQPIDQSERGRRHGRPS
ncbi:hypothetical protein B0E38_01502 [Streptomyces sp. 111WW2]|nr:hypothetical protein B0E38_01502 [Streptomyces sp. 111WW2]